MTQQALDLRGSIQIVRRCRKTFWSFFVIGLLIGALYAVLRPPMLTSTALVVLPAAPVPSDQAVASDPGQGVAAYVDTQAVVATSTPVLSTALPRVSPPISLQALRGRIQASILTDSILSISASGTTATQAKDIANAVASSYVGFVTSKRSPMGVVPAKILQPAATASGLTLSEQVALDGLLGGIGGAIAGFTAALAIGRGNRRLTERDAIARSIGAPVLASLQVGHPSDATSWRKLLEDYSPGAVQAWALRNMLQQLGLARGARGGGGHAGGHQPIALTVLSLSSDPKALALGPQLAVFAASLGIPTALVIGPQQDPGSVAALRTACAGAPGGGVTGSGKPLRLVVSESGDFRHPGAAFTVVVTVVDGEDPRMPDAARTTGATVLGVSAGAVTAEQLARAATAAASDGREISGILVADPEPADQTTGRIPRLAPPAPRQMPTRVNDVPTEIRR